MKSPHSLLAGRDISSLQKKVSSSILLLLLLTGCTRPQVDPMPGSDPNLPGNDSELVYFNLTASTDDYRKISLKWDAQKGNPTYHILRATDSLQAKYDEIGSTSEATFIDAKVEFDKLYYYKIQAQYSSTNVVTSNDITIGRIQQPTDYNLAYEAYTNLAVATGGKRYDITEAGVLPETIIRIINEQVKGDKADIVFLIDNTGSMVDEINAVKKGLDKIISALPPSTRLGAGGYRDHEDLYQLRFQDLTTNFSVVRGFINKMTANGGGDKPEDIYDALYGTVTQATWVNKKRIVILIGDSSPHEGNLTQHSYTEVINKYQQAGVEVNINPILIREE